jgi:hypothetical protein
MNPSLPHGRPLRVDKQKKGREEEKRRSHRLAQTRKPCLRILFGDEADSVSGNSFALAGKAESLLGGGLHVDTV